MDLSYGEAAEEFREEVRAFVKRRWAPQSVDRSEMKAYVAQFRKAATEAGYLYRAIPKKWGGSEQSPDVIKAQVIREEFTRARAPMEVPGNGMNMLVRALVRIMHGAMGVALYDWRLSWQDCKKIEDDKEREVERQKALRAARHRLDEQERQRIRDEANTLAMAEREAALRAQRQARMEAEGAERRRKAEEEEEARNKARAAPEEPSEKEREEHDMTHLPHQAWCPHCVAGKAPNEAHRRQEEEESKMIEEGRVLKIC